MASFLAGFGGGYLKSSRQATEDERQAKMDKITTDRAQRETDEWEKKQNYEKGLAAAGAPVKAEQANDVLMDDDGNAMPAVPAFRTSEGQRFTTMAEAQGVADKSNTPEAINARQAAFMQAQGKPLEAIQMNNAVMDSKLKKLGLTAAEGKFAQDEFNRKLTTTISSQSTPEDGIAKVLTETQLGGLKGVTAKYRPSADGKSVEYFGVDAEGKETPLMTLPKGPAGIAEFMQQAGQVNFETKLGYLVERAKTDKADTRYDSEKAKEDARYESKEAKENDRWERTFEFNKKKDENDQQYKNRVLGFQARQEARAAQTHKLAMEDAKIPPAVKQTADFLAKQMESTSAAINKAMAENSFDPNSANAKSLIERQAMLGIQYRTLMQPHMPGGKDKPSADPLDLDKPAPAAATPSQAATPAQSGEPATQKPLVSMGQAVPPQQPAAAKAPVRTTDGGKTWSLDIPKTIRDPSVKWYREIPNPAYQAIGGKAFANAEEARAAFAALQQ
jgi:hypothetical protein